MNREGSAVIACPMIHWPDLLLPTHTGFSLHVWLRAGSRLSLPSFLRFPAGAADYRPPGGGPRRVQPSSGTRPAAGFSDRPRRSHCAVTGGGDAESSPSVSRPGRDAGAPISDRPAATTRAVPPAVPSARIHPCPEPGAPGTTPAGPASHLIGEAGIRLDPPGHCPDEMSRTLQTREVPGKRCAATGGFGPTSILSATPSVSLFTHRAELTA